MDSFYLFILASCALIVTPGPDLIYVLTRGVSGGRNAGLLSAVGVVSGILVHTIAASLGLAILLQTSQIAFWSVKVLGGIYLIYMGVQLLISKKSFHFDSASQEVSVRKCLVQGFLSNVLNPKVALFFVSFLPQFVSPSSAPQSSQMIVFGLVFAGLTILFLGFVGCFSGWIGNWLKKKPKAANPIRWGSGGILTLLGLKLLVPESK